MGLKLGRVFKKITKPIRSIGKEITKPIFGVLGGGGGGRGAIQKKLNQNYELKAQPLDPKTEYINSLKNQFISVVDVGAKKKQGTYVLDKDWFKNTKKISYYDWLKGRGINLEEQFGITNQKTPMGFKNTIILPFGTNFLYGSLSRQKPRKEYFRPPKEVLK